VLRVCLLAVVGVAVAGMAASHVPDGGAAGTKIFGSVGPGFSISVTDAAGNAVSNLEPGPYELVVSDKSEFHNFRLTGPGVSIATTVEGMGEETFQITVAGGKYTYLCDPHSGSMNGSFTVGSGGSPSDDGYGGPSTSGPGDTSTPTPTKPAAVAPSAAVGATLNLTVGPGFTIKLKTKAGKAVTSLKAGAYVFVVRDRAASHNAHLAGAGIDKATGVRFVGTRTLKLTLRKGKLTFVCDPHRAVMKGAVAVS
jgi:plastocyanin